MNPIAPHITAFLQERLPLDCAASPNTCESYAYTFQLLFQFASERFNVTPSELKLEQLDSKLVIDFLAHIESQRKNTATTRNIRLSAIKSFMRFVEHRVPSALEQSRRIRAIPTKSADKRLVNYLSMIEMEAILNAPNLETRAGIRDRAMLHLCFAGGLRVSELTGLLLTSVRLNPTPAISLIGKGRKERCLPLWKETAADVRAWLAVRGTPPAPELFVNARGESMTRAGFAYLLDKYVEEAAHTCPLLQGKRVSPHVLRHTCAMMIYQATGDLRKVSLWLGHAQIQTSDVYLRADPMEKIEAIEKMIPPSLKKGHFTVSDKLIASLRAKNVRCATDS